MPIIRSISLASWSRLEPIPILTVKSWEHHSAGRANSINVKSRRNRATTTTTTNSHNKWIRPTIHFESVCLLLVAKLILLQCRMWCVINIRHLLLQWGHNFAWPMRTMDALVATFERPNPSRRYLPKDQFQRLWTPVFGSLEACPNKSGSNQRLSNDFLGAQCGFLWKRNKLLPLWNPNYRSLSPSSNIWIYIFL